MPRLMHKKYVKFEDKITNEFGKEVGEIIIILCPAEAVRKQRKRRPGWNIYKKANVALIDFCIDNNATIVMEKI